MTKSRVLVITNFATHYRAPLFELMHERLGAEFVFFSQGGEEYWQPHLGVSTGRFPGVTVPSGPSVGKLRLNAELWNELQSREFDVVIKCMNGRTELPLSYAAARRRGAAFVLWTGMWMHPSSAFHMASRPLARWVYRNSDAVVTYGDHVSRFVVSEGADAAGVFSAENAVNNTAYSLDVSTTQIAAVRQQFEIGEDRVVLAVSRLVAGKGLEVLIDAMAGLVSPAQLVIVGTGPLSHMLRQRASDHGVRLSLVEGLSPHAMPPMYATAHVFVMPSITTRTFREPWGLACNEAMCQAVPVVATTAVGAAAGGLVRDNETGLVVSEQNSDALREAIQRLLSDEVLAARLGENGRMRVKRTDYSNMVDGFECAIQRALARRGAQA